MSTTHVRGHEVWHEQVGDDGPPVLMIMGFGMSGIAWKPLAESLSDAFRLVYYDNRGIGRSTAGDGPHSLAGLADDAAALMDALGWSTAHVVGVSMGGMVAQHLALRHRHRVRSLALIATHPGPFHRCAPTPKGLRRFLRVNTSTGERRLKALKKLLYPRAVRDRFELDGFDASFLSEVAVPSDPAIRVRHVSAILAHDSATALSALRDLPSVILRPDLDILVPPHGSDRLHDALHDSTLVPFPEAGHGLIAQQPDAVSQVLRDHWHDAEA